MNTDKHITVLFICTGNICRSPMAEFIFRHLVDQAGIRDKFIIASAATSSWEIGEPVHPGTQSVLRKNRIPIDIHKRARQVGPDDYLKFDYVLAMDAYNLRNMPIMEKIHRITDFAGSHWPKDVPDPYYTGDFDYVYEFNPRGMSRSFRSYPARGRVAMNLPAEMLPSLLSALGSYGDDTKIQSVTPLTGGCINQTVRLETRRADYLIKWNHAPLPGMFNKEAYGLRLLAQTKTVRTPEVIAVVDENQPDPPAFIILEYIHHPMKNPNQWDPEKLGAQLAEMHQKTAMTAGQQFGLDQDNYLGASLQPNKWSDDWITFFRDYRLGHQMQLAQSNGRLFPTRQKMIIRLLDRLPQFLVGVSHQPSLLHGDLWSGNVIPDIDNRATLIDPAVYYGDREAEIAYTELFGGFNRRFYQAYNETWPLDKNYSERRDLYNTYHLLNHLNLFGEAYGSQLDAILKYYVG